MHSLLQDNVLPNDLCIGCGGCTFHIGGGSKMAFDERGQYTPVIASDADASVADPLCPFSGMADDEDTLGQALFGGHGEIGLTHDARLGFYRSVSVGHANEGDFRLAGSSGGLTNWLLHELFQQGEIDAVIGVGELAHAPGGTQYGYQIIESASELHRLAKSKYYPVTLDEVLRSVHARDLRYAFVGVPCFVKTVRNLCRQHPVLEQRIRFCIAIVCGHLKSRAFAQSIGWELGVAPATLESVDFRVKVPGAPANRYAVEVKGAHTRRQQQVFDLFTSDWGLGFFKYKACDFCDDIAGETADVTFGDAWLPEPVKAWQGHNIVVVRHPLIARLLEHANKAGRITLDDVTSDDFVASQGANYRHRHDGLAIRLQDAKAADEWVPQKRVAPSYAHASKKRQRVIRLRNRLREESHQAFITAKQRGSFKTFKRKMQPRVLRYHLAAGSLTKYLVKRVLINVRRVIKIRV